jgi:hypothetical protein
VFFSRLHRSFLAAEYKEIKSEYEGEIEKPERKIEEQSTLDSDLNEQISLCCDLLQNLQILRGSGPYRQATNTWFDILRRTGFFRNFISNYKM